MLQIIIFIALSFLIYKYSASKFQKSLKTNNIPESKIHHQKRYFAIYVTTLCLIISICIFAIGSYIANKEINNALFPKQSTQLQSVEQQVLKSNVKSFAQNSQHIQVDLNINNIKTTSVKYNYYHNTANIAVFIGIFCIIFIIVFTLTRKISSLKNYQKQLENIVKFLMFLCSGIAFVATFSIIVSLCITSVHFFTQINVFNFLFGLHWSPETSSIDPQHSFGIIPLLTGTFLVAFISVFIALFLGILSAVYMSEYMAPKTKKIFQPIFETLAGIPSVVYGFFAAITISPIVIHICTFFNLEASSENAITISLVMGIMILPFVSSTITDVISTIPKHVKEGAYGIGSMKHEVILYVLLPASLPGIISSAILAMSRAIGETMIIVMAGSIVAKLTLNPLSSVTTMTAQIVTLIKGDQEFSSPNTLSAFALGLTLLIITFILNLIAIKIVNVYNKKYR